VKTISSTTLDASETCLLVLCTLVVSVRLMEAETSLAEQLVTAAQVRSPTAQKAAQGLPVKL